jgi:hypothetical protein
LEGLDTTLELFQRTLTRLLLEMLKLVQELLSSLGQVAKSTRRGIGLCGEVLQSWAAFAGLSRTETRISSRGRNVRHGGNLSSWKEWQSENGSAGFTGFLEHTLHLFFDPVIGPALLKELLAEHVGQTLDVPGRCASAQVSPLVPRMSQDAANPGPGAIQHLSTAHVSRVARQEGTDFEDRQVVARGPSGSWFGSWPSLSSACGKSCCIMISTTSSHLPLS